MSRTSGGAATTFCPDGGTVVLEKQGSTTTVSYSHALWLLTRSGEAMHYDGHGSLRTVTNAAQAITATGNWEAYGTSVGGTGSSARPTSTGRPAATGTTG